jgi:hypothetical protein
MKKFIVVLIICIQFIQVSFAQQTFLFKFNPLFQHSTLSLDSIYNLNNKATIQFETLKLYISNIEFYKKDQFVDRENTSYHLLDCENTQSLNLKIPKNNTNEFDRIQFQVGIDSVTNNAGAMGGDLDPTKGMYWTWQNGYINFKLEGKTSNSTARNHSFEFHIGGYTAPFATIQTITFNTENQGQIHIDIDIEKLIRDLDFSTLNHVMSPGVEAVKLSEKVKTIFSLHQ